MKKEHTLSLYRNSPSVGRTPAGRPIKDLGEPLAIDVPCQFQAGDGRLMQEVGGKQVQIAGLLFVHPRDWPPGTGPRRNDLVDITTGPADPTRYRVHDVRPLGGGRWDDELVLAYAMEPLT